MKLSVGSAILAVTFLIGTFSPAQKILFAMSNGTAPVQPFNVYKDKVDIRISMAGSDFFQRMLPVIGRRPHEGVQRLNLYMPCMMVYDPDGVLIYYSTDATKNAAFLSVLPAAVKGRTRIKEGYLQRDEALEIVPAFGNVKSMVQTDRRYLVLAITQTGNQPSCAAQDRAVEALERRQSSVDIDVLQLALDMKKK
jgi:hypothetical protein